MCYLLQGIQKHDILNKRKKNQEPLKISTEEGIKAIGWNEYFKVSAIVEYSGSEDSGQGQLIWHTRRRESSGEFGRIFRSACDELRQKAGESRK